MGRNACAPFVEMHQQVWINTGYILLIGLRDFGIEIKTDILIKYFDEETKELQEPSVMLDHVKSAVRAIYSDCEMWFEVGTSDEEYDDEE